MTVVPEVTAFAVLGILAGLWLLWKGFGGYRTATRIGDTGTSAIATMAAGEVRISGVIEPAEVTIVSPLQSATCVYYRATIDEDTRLIDLDPTTDFEEERAVGFRLRDASGDVRVFPRGARWDAPLRLDATSGSLGERPSSLHLRTGPAVASGIDDREARIAALLSVRPAAPEASLRTGTSGRGRRYREARLEPGDTVTIVGRALPFTDLTDPTEADVAIGNGVGADDPEVAADLAEARAAGRLADDPEAAWGNAAIPGFGIGAPVREPLLDPEAARPVLATPAEADRFERTFAIPPEALVLASAPGVPLLIAHGHPEVAADRHADRFVVGLLGAVLAIGSAMAFAVMLGGGFGT